MQSPLPLSELRRSAIPATVEIPANLPIAGLADELRALLHKHQVVVVAGETGSGKTTQLPKICLQAGFGIRGLIGHTQPRRLAAVAVANRIAEELQATLGQGVGCQIRFADQTSDATYLKLMTDGILLNEIQRDRLLKQYEVLIIDEAHERSLNIDFILGYLKRILPQRPDLKILITSATIDLQKFATHFSDAPVVSVSGRLFPVAIQYAPIEGRDEDGDDPQIDAIVDAVRKVESQDREDGGVSGDILVFLATEKEIRETALALRKHTFRDTEILPLYARLRQAEQHRIFQSHSGRRVILSTNIAETSLTVPGIRYVIDTGFARISRYSVQNKLQRLPIEPVSRASADQRAGRCGRVADGICIRLYPESDYLARPAFTEPEILRTNLAAVILQMLFLRLGAVDSFPFIDPPSDKAINDGYNLLYELSAIDEDRQLTPTGRKMAALPVEPRFARILLAASTYNCLKEILIIVSGLSISDPRESRGDDVQGSPAGKTLPDSDFLALTALWNDFEKQRQDGNNQQLRRYCQRNALSLSRMFEWREVHRQLLGLCRSMNFSLNRHVADYEPIHRSLLAGLLNFIGCLTEGGIYQGTRNRKFRLLRSSLLSSRGIKWLVSSQIIETSFAFASIAARIESDWVIYEGGHLVKRSWSEPHWSKRRQQVEAYEKTTLYGLVLEDRKPVNYGPLDPETSRELFIREALVEDALEIDQEFYRHNRKLLADIARDEEKVRKQSWLVDPRQVERFYRDRIPEPVWDRQTFLNWYKQDREKLNRKLRLTLDDLNPDESRQALLAQFPSQTELHKNRLSIHYAFKPGTKSDGAVVDLPLALLAQLTDSDLDWIVPGQLRERCIALLKSLPKQLRKNFIPVSGFVDQILPALVPGTGSLADALIDQIRRSKGLQLTRADLEQTVLPEYLKVKIRIVDEDGRELALGSDIERLRQDLSVQLKELSGESAEAGQRHALECDGLQDWIIPELPQQVETGGRVRLLRFPALIDQGDSVNLRLLGSRQDAQRLSVPGIARLLMLRTAQQRALLLKQFRQLEKQWGIRAPEFLRSIGEPATMAVYATCFGLHGSLPRSRDQFEKRLSEHRAELIAEGNELARVLDRIVALYFELGRQLPELPAELKHLRDDVTHQMALLFPENFLQEADGNWLREYPRYLQAICLRIERARLQPEKDRQLTEQIRQKQQRWEDGRIAATADTAELQQYRWLLEEYRVSLFAQQLKTRLPVSGQRLDKQWAKCMGR